MPPGSTRTTAADARPLLFEAPLPFDLGSGRETSAGVADPPERTVEEREVLDLLASLASVHDTGGPAHLRVLPALAARYAEPRHGLSPAMRRLLDQRGIPSLYTHQAAAVDVLAEGRSIAVATGTASGKSLCYQIPMVEAALAGRRETALLLFPTKALAHDQLRAMRSWLVPDLVSAPYDGDATQDERVWTRRYASAVLTNPDMLHVGILPFHDRWATFLMRLRLVVVDELHVLRGVFGSHVAHVLRRLRRLCLRYGADPQFCFTSATVGNAGELAHALSGRDIDVIDDDGSPRPARVFVLWDRAVRDERRGLRSSGNQESGRLLAGLVSHGRQALAFTRSRVGAELIARAARAALRHQGGGVDPGVIAAYRGGFLAEERRALEQRLADGSLRGIAATNALELGIDIGGLDAVVINGFPGTIASLWQQAGRAGRNGADDRPAVAALVAGDDQLDRWYFTHPDELFSRSPEAAVVNPWNPYVLRPQLACAAFEQPLTPADEVWFGEGLHDGVRDLVHADLLRPRDGRMFWAAREPPAPAVSLRSGSPVEYRLIDTDDRPVGTVDGSRVFSVAHPGAVYVHQGRQFRVASLDLERRQAIVAETDADEWTQTRHATDVEILCCSRAATVGALTAYVGTVAVSSQVTAYQRRSLATGEVIEVVDLDLPRQHLETTACWFEVPRACFAAAELTPNRIGGAVHAVEHAFIGMLPRAAICDRWDVGGVSMAVHPQTGEPTIFVYDGYPGGAGLAELGFDVAERTLEAVAELVGACPCDDGCPSCVQSPKCGNWNEYLDKAAAVALLGAALGPRAPRRRLRRTHATA